MKKFVLALCLCLALSGAASAGVNRYTYSGYNSGFERGYACGSISKIKLVAAGVTCFFGREILYVVSKTAKAITDRVYEVADGLVNLDIRKIF